MTEFVTSHGFKFVTGKNMHTGLEDAYQVSWNDPATGTWEPKMSNSAGSFILPEGPPFSPNVDVREKGGEVYIDGRWRFTFVGAPFTWEVTRLLPTEEIELCREIDEELARTKDFRE